MKKRLLTVLLLISVGLSGCGSASTKETAKPDDSGSAVSSTEDKSEENSGEEVSENSGENEKASEESEEKSEDTKESTAEDSTGNTTGDGKVMNLSLLGDKEEKYYDESLVPSVPAYKVADDFSNVVYDKKFDSYFNPEYENEYNKVTELREALIKNSFAVSSYGQSEFFDVYESNRYDYFPNFITVDSLMHTYHLYFSYLMKTTEKNYLSETLLSLGETLAEKSIKQYEELKGTSWENAARRNAEFFTIGVQLQGGNAPKAPDDKEFIEAVEYESDKIMAAEALDKCSISGLDEDYSQYKVRGYYEGDEILEKYFRAMMWYGRTAFPLDNEDTLKSSVLMTMAIGENPDDWASIYSITSFFAGASDDPGYAAFADIVNECYEKDADLKSIAEDTASLDKVKAAASKLELPKINSVPVDENEEAIIPSFRFMGQRFTIDEAIMQRLVYRYVGENVNGERRMLPDALDMAAALGSETAFSILEESGATEFENYTDNLTLMSGYFNNDNEAIWNASLYAGWLNTLRPLLAKKTEGYPSYMLSEDWAKKDLETFEGSYAELKHDTILYSKQLMAEMGGGDDEDIPDDRGYVDPEPVVYSRFVFLADKTAEGLENYGMLDSSSKKDLELLSEIAMKLLQISEKELKNESLSDEEYEFIRCYGGDLEHFWKEVNKDSENDLSYSYQAPCPVVADIATDPNGTVLEVGSGKASKIYVVFPIDGELHIGSGSAYSFYQFTVPRSERMTDTEWRNRLEGSYLDEDWNWVEAEEAPPQPEWTQSYRMTDKW